MNHSNNMRKSFLLSMLLAMVPGISAAGSVPKVWLETSSGNILIELYPEKAPLTVENFLAYVKSGFYDGTIFHRVIGNFMLQGGGFTQDFEKKPTRDPIENEANNGLDNDRGTIVMARTNDPHSATAQFFINVVDNDFLNFSSSQTPQTWGYAVFGKVIEGMDVVDKIRKIPTGSGGPFQSDVPRTPVVINRAYLADATVQAPPE